MVDAAYSHKLQFGRAAVRARWQLIIPLVAAFVPIGGRLDRVGLQCNQQAARELQMSPRRRRRGLR
jgi:hypothetical protein